MYVLSNTTFQVLLLSWENIFYDIQAMIYVSNVRQNGIFGALEHGLLYPFANMIPHLVKGRLWLCSKVPKVPFCQPYYTRHFLFSSTPRNFKCKIALTFIIHRKVALFQLSKVPKKLRESNTKSMLQAEERFKTNLESMQILHLFCLILPVWIPHISNPKWLIIFLAIN